MSSKRRTDPKRELKERDKEARTVVHALSGVEKRRVDDDSGGKAKGTKARR